MVRYVKIGKETSYGDGATTAGVLCTASNFTVDRSVIRENRVDQFLPGGSNATAYKVSGKLSGTVRPAQLDVLLHTLLGAKATNSGTDDYEYTLGYPGSMEIDVGESNDTFDDEVKYLGCIPNQCTFKFEPKDYVTFDCDVVCQQPAEGTYGMPTFAAEEPTLTWGASVSIASASNTEVKSMDMVINRNVDAENFVVGSPFLKRVALTDSTSVEFNVTFTEHEADEIKSVMYGDSSGTSVPATNDLDTLAITIACIYADDEGTDAFTISSPVSIAETMSKNMNGGASEVENTIKFTANQTASSVFMITKHN